MSTEAIAPGEHSVAAGRHGAKTDNRAVGQTYVARTEGAIRVTASASLFFTITSAHDRDLPKHSQTKRRTRNSPAVEVADILRRHGLRPLSPIRQQRVAMDNTVSWPRLGDVPDGARL
jgi:hypothetical protein